jgi:hypothetical protein
VKCTLDQAKNQDVTLIKLAFVLDSIKKGKRMKERDYEVFLIVHEWLNVQVSKPKKRKIEEKSKGSDSDDDKPVVKWFWQSDRYNITSTSSITMYVQWLGRL